MQISLALLRQTVGRTQRSEGVILVGVVRFTCQDDPVHWKWAVGEVVELPLSVLHDWPMCIVIEFLMPVVWLACRGYYTCTPRLVLVGSRSKVAVLVLHVSVLKCFWVSSVCPTQVPLVYPPHTIFAYNGRLCQLVIKI